MNKIKCENKMKEMGLWYDMLVDNDGYITQYIQIKINIGFH